LNGINVFEDTEVLSLTAENNRVVGALTANEAFMADVTVLATGAWTSLIQLGGMPIPVSVKPIRGQMISYHPPKKLIRRVVFGRQGYLVPRNNGRILAGATVEDVGFDRSATDEGANELSAAAAAIVPRLGQLKIADHWAGLRPFGQNGLPILGCIPGLSGMAVATAHFRNGILLAPITAKIIADKIVSGVDSKYLNIFGVKDAAAGVRKGVV
jgi:glycine oxidase